MTKYTTDDFRQFQITRKKLGEDALRPDELAALETFEAAAPKMLAALSRIAGNGPDSPDSLRSAKQIASAAVALAHGEA